MPPENPEKIDEILVLLGKSREFIKASENLFQNRLAIPALNEFRNISYHLALHIANPQDQKHTEAALRHAKKAYLDANEAYAVALIEGAISAENRYAGYSDIISVQMKDYTVLRTCVLDLHREMRDASIASEEDRFIRAQHMEEFFPHVVQYLESFNTLRPALDDAVRKDFFQSKQARANKRLTVISIAVAIISTILGCLVTWLLA